MSTATVVETHEIPIDGDSTTPSSFGSSSSSSSSTSTSKPIDVRKFISNVITGEITST